MKTKYKKITLYTKDTIFNIMSLSAQKQSNLLEKVKIKIEKQNYTNNFYKNI